MGSVMLLLVDEKGFDQCKNDVCLFRLWVKLLLWVDDNLMRGARRRTDTLWDDMDAKFGLNHRDYLECGVSRTFIGTSLLKSKLNGQTVYCMDQNAEVRAFLTDTPVVGIPLKSPMRDQNDLYVNDTPASKQEATWFRSKLMSCSYYACWTRLDIACTVNRLAQKLTAPSVSAVDELKRLIRYLNGRPDFTISLWSPLDLRLLPQMNGRFMLTLTWQGRHRGIPRAERAQYSSSTRCQFTG
jgi:hypothetical protein